MAPAMDICSGRSMSAGMYLWSGRTTFTAPPILDTTGRIQRVSSGALLFASVLRLGIYAVGQACLLRFRLEGSPVVRILWRLLQSIPHLYRAQPLAGGVSFIPSLA